MSQINFICKKCGGHHHRESTETQRELNKDKKRGLCLVCATKEDIDNICVDMSNIACNFETLHFAYAKQLDGIEKNVMRIAKYANRILDVISKAEVKEIMDNAGLDVASDCD